MPRHAVALAGILILAASAAVSENKATSDTEKELNNIVRKLNVSAFSLASENYGRLIVWCADAMADQHYMEWRDHRDRLFSHAITATVEGAVMVDRYIKWRDEANKKGEKIDDTAFCRSSLDNAEIDMIAAIAKLRATSSP